MTPGWTPHGHCLAGHATAEGKRHAALGVAFTG